MAEQLKINYSSAYLKYQILKGAWLVHKQAIEGQLRTVYGFLNNELVLDDSFTEPESTLPYTIKLNTPNSIQSLRNIAVIPISGSLMKSDYCGAPGMQTIAARIKQADESESVSGIILKIDSPGGTVDGTQELGDVVKNVSKPIVSFADGLMASAAYWVGSSADMVIAKDTTTEVGSIGVVISFIDNRKALEAEGYEFHDIFADQSNEKWKEMLDATKGDYSTIKEWTLNPIAEEFQNTVKDNRPNVNDKSLHGRVYLAKDAKRYGLIDKIGNFEFAIKELNKLITNNNRNIMSEKNTEKVVEMTVTADEQGFLDKLLNKLKPEVKDISGETKAEYDTKIATLESEKANLEAELVGLKEEKEALAIDKAKVEESEATKTLLTENLNAELNDLKVELTKKVAENVKIESDEDKLEIGKLSAEDAAWVKEATAMKQNF